MCEGGSSHVHGSNSYIAVLSPIMTVLRDIKRPPKADSCGHLVSVSGDAPSRYVTELRPSADLSTAVPVSYYSALCHQTTSPVQPFAMGSSPKEATVSEGLLVATFRQGQWSRDHKEDSEVRSILASPPGCSSSSSLGPAVIWGSRGHVGGCVLLTSRALTVAPIGQAQALRRQ